MLQKIGFFAGLQVCELASPRACELASVILVLQLHDLFAGPYGHELAIASLQCIDLLAGRELASPRACGLDAGAAIY